MAAKNIDQPQVDEHDELEQEDGPPTRGLVDERKSGGRSLPKFKVNQKVRMRKGGEGSAFKYSVTIVGKNWNESRSGWDYDVEDSAGSPTDGVPQSDLQKDK